MSGYNYFAANNQFRSQHLRMRGGFMPPPPLGGGNFTSVTNVNIKNGTGNGFLDFALGVMHGLGGGRNSCQQMSMPMGGCCGSLWGGGFGGFGGWQPVFPQLTTTTTPTTSTTQTTEKTPLQKLKDIYTSWTISEHPTNKDVYVAIKDGTQLEGTIDQLYESIKNANAKKPDDDNTKVDPEKDPEKAPEKAPGTVDDGSGKVGSPVKAAKITKSGNADKKSVDAPKGDILHKAANGDVVTKDSSTSPAQYHYYKYDSATGKYTETNETEFRATHNKGNNAINLTALKEGGNTTNSIQQDKRFRSQNGRYAEQDKNGQWHYYSNDGEKLKPDDVLNKNSQGYDPTLAAKTQTQPKQKSTQEQIANATANVVQNKY